MSYVSENINFPALCFDKVYTGLDHAPRSFDLRGKIVGAEGSNLDFIIEQTGAFVSLCGGLEINGSEKNEPLHLLIQHSRLEQLSAARNLALNLVDVVRTDLLDFLKQTGETSVAPSSSTPNVSKDDRSVVASDTPLKIEEGKGAVMSKKKLSGAARKRLRRLASSMDFEKAFALCKKPWSEIGEPVLLPEVKPLKRNCSHEPSDEKPIKAPKMNTELVDKSDLSGTRDVERSFQVEIHNTEPMSEVQMNLVHRSLILAIGKIGKKGSGPRFVGFTRKPGKILVTCENQESRDWLVREVKSLKPWPEAQLSILYDSGLPSSALTATVFISNVDAKSLNEALSLIKVQNDGLNTELWRVLHVNEKQFGRVVTFRLDESSVKTLRASDFKVIIGFKKVLFKFKGGQSSSPDATNPNPNKSPPGGSCESPSYMMFGNRDNQSGKEVGGWSMQAGPPWADPTLRVTPSFVARESNGNDCRW